MGSEEHLGETPEGPSHTRCEDQSRKKKTLKNLTNNVWFSKEERRKSGRKEEEKKRKDVLRIHTTF